MNKPELYLLHLVKNRNDIVDEDKCYHTHGVAQFSKGYEVEILLDISNEEAAGYIDNMVDNLIYDASYVHGEIVDCLGPKKVQVLVLNSYDNFDTLVYRLVIADDNGRFPNDPSCNLAYTKQYNLKRNCLALECDVKF